ncbi:MAG: response regulator transcription factor [Betaproteobacteria bacterium]
MAIHVLVIEDDQLSSAFVASYLEKAGMTVTIAHTAKKAKSLLKPNDFHLIVLDILLPDGDGLSLCQEICKSDQRVGIVMLSVKGEQSDRIAGLELGADDYIAKPYHPRELLMRLQAIHRRINFIMRTQCCQRKSTRSAM